MKQKLSIHIVNNGKQMIFSIILFISFHLLTRNLLFAIGVPTSLFCRFRTTLSFVRNNNFSDMTEIACCGPNKLTEDIIWPGIQAFSSKSRSKLEIFTKYVYIKSPTVCPLVGIGTLPTPLSPASVPLPPEPGGGHTRLRLRGWGSPNSEDWIKSLGLCLLCGSYPRPAELWPDSLHPR